MFPNQGLGIQIDNFKSCDCSKMPEDDSQCQLTIYDSRNLTDYMMDDTQQRKKDEPVDDYLKRVSKKSSQDISCGSIIDRRKNEQAYIAYSTPKVAVECNDKTCCINKVNEQGWGADINPVKQLINTSCYSYKE